MYVIYFNHVPIYWILIMIWFFQKMFLAAFDFDHTIIEENSDVSVLQLAPNGIPHSIKLLYDVNRGWTEYMRNIFQFLHEQNNRPEDLLKVLHSLKLVDGMHSLLSSLGNSDLFDVIVISDANSVFIEEILKTNNLFDTVDHIFTNPAHFDAEGLLHVKEYHEQDWCELSTQNLCKGHILTNFMKNSGNDYSTVFYAGDGSNDFCPMTKLRQWDVALPRNGHKIMKTIEKHQSTNSPYCIESKVCPWNNGVDLMKIIQESIEKYKIHI